jgi:ParB/RepB/Spo0J family partition protein
MNKYLNVSDIKVIDVDMNDIEIGSRFRSEMGNIEALASSITKDGLIQPIAIMKNDGEKPYKLVAGGRRYRALEFIKMKHNIKAISCRLYEKDMSELEIRTLEFAENLYRKDLTWQEECRLKERLFNLQQRIHGVKVSTAKDAPGWSLTDMEKMTGRSKGSLSQDISMAKMMDSTPDVNWEQFKTKDDAMKALKTAKNKVIQSSDAKRAIASLGTGESLRKKIIDSYHIKDFFEGVKNIGNGTMDIVELDPPYAIDLEKQKKGYSYTGYNEIDPKDYPSFMRRVFTECYRVLKPNSWIICWFGPEPWFDPIHHWLTEAGFTNKRLPALWVKGEENDEHVVEKTSGQCMQPERDLAKAFEFFFYARKGIPTLAKPGARNTFGYKPIPPQHKVHPTERPIEMMTDILTTFAQPNSNVLVPFAGSGNTLIAAAQNQMIPIGFDLTKEYHESYTIKCYKLL